MRDFLLSNVTPAKAGAQLAEFTTAQSGIPAFAGMTVVDAGRETYKAGTTP